MDDPVLLLEVSIGVALLCGVLPPTSVGVLVVSTVVVVVLLIVVSIVRSWRNWN